MKLKSKIKNRTSLEPRVALVLPLLVHAQRLSHPVIVSRDDAFSSPAAPLAGPDTVRVLVLMVQFQKDSTDRSTGNGQFDLTTTSTPALDSPPHDAAYLFDAFVDAMRSRRAAKLATAAR